MLHFIEELSRRSLPSFETAEGLVNHFCAESMFAQVLPVTHKWPPG